MKKRTVENLLKQAKEIKAPESVWEKIEKEQIILKCESTKKQTKTKTRYYTIAGLAACAAAFLLILTTIIKIGIDNTPSIKAEITNDNSNVISQTQNDGIVEMTSENVTSQESSTSQDNSMKSEAGNKTQSSKPGSMKGNSNHASGINVPVFRVWNHNFYQCVDVQISESMLDKSYTQVINGNEFTIYSLKGKSIDECFVWKANNMYHYYECIYKGIFYLNGKNYGLESQAKYINQEKGKYLGEVDGIKVYEFLGNDDAILVDMTPIIGFGDSEELYVASLIE